MTTIETTRMILRPPVQEDGSAVVGFLNDLETARMMARIPYPYRLDDWRSFLQYLKGGEEEALVLTDRRDSRLMGLISLSLDEKEPLLGYWLGKPYRGKGLMKEAGAAVLQRGFSVHAAPSIRAGHFKENIASAKTLKALGFVAYEETEELSLARGDEKVPHVTMRLTREDFEARHPAG